MDQSFDISILGTNLSPGWLVAITANGAQSTQPHWPSMNPLATEKWRLRWYSVPLLHACYLIAYFKPVSRHLNRVVSMEERKAH